MGVGPSYPHPLPALPHGDERQEAEASESVISVGQPQIPLGLGQSQFMPVVWV